MHIIQLNRKPVKKQVAEKLCTMNVIEGFGPEGDAYGGPGERQLTILGKDDLEILLKDREKGICIKRFAPNLEISGTSSKLKKGTYYKIGEVEIKISDTGKKCHKGCQLLEEKRICLLPEKALFATIIKGGMIKVDDEIVESAY